MSLRFETKSGNVQKEMDRLLEKQEKEIQKWFKSQLGAFVLATIKKKTPVWERFKGDKKSKGWEKVRSGFRSTVKSMKEASLDVGGIAGHAKNKWKMAVEQQVGNIRLIFSNNLPYIRVLEFGGFGDFKQWKVWGTYHSKDTPRTKPSNDPSMNNNVSRQAPKGMMRITFQEAREMIKKKYGAK